METKIRDWYMEAYPQDELGVEIGSEVTFEDLFNALDHYRDVYKVIGVGDSVIRERCFSRLAELMDVGYDYIYDQWLRAV